MEWTRGGMIGRGATASVSVATENGSGRVFAVKSCRVSDSEFLQREERILSRLDSPYIVGYRGCGISSENGGLMYNLFLDYASGGSVADEIRRSGGGMEEGRVRWVTRAVLMGLEYLHSNGIVHCDIKAENLLVAPNGAKIADFGCSRWVDDVSGGDWKPVIRGTPLYMAPEVARGEYQGFSADIWALGCTVVQMVTGRPAWVGFSDPATILYRVGCSGDTPEIPICLSNEAKDFVSKCLIKDPTERWSASELLKHDFVNKPCPFSSEFDVSDPVTPISILNQSIWNSTQDTIYSSENENSSYESPYDRMRKLSEASTMLAWTWNGTWITVRGIENAVEISHLCEIPSGSCELSISKSCCRASWFLVLQLIRSLVIKLACNRVDNLLCRVFPLINKAIWFLVLSVTAFGYLE